MEIISQTNRTILFEYFNDEKDNILTIIGDVENLESLDDEKIKEINEKLLVSSFEEFLYKFNPKIYSYMDVANKKISYSLTKNPNIPDSYYKEIPINLENSFIKMLCTLIDNRKNMDLKNIDFKYEDILEMISPKKIIEDIKQTRKEINYLYEKYEALDDSNPRKLDYGDKLNYKFNQASQNYNNVLAMLPLAIEDIKTRLSLGEKKDSQNCDLIKLGYLEFTEKGEIEFIENNEEKIRPKLLPKNSENLALIFKEDYNNSTDNPQEYVANLISRTFVPISSSNININFENEVNNYNNYLSLYKQSQEDFIKIAKNLIEKILGVKLFFDQYNVNQKLMQPKLLITNVKNDILIQPNQRDKIDKYLNSVNSKNEFDNIIWYAIWPNISLEDELFRNKGPFKVNNKVKNEDLNNIENLSNIASTLSKYKIQTFFNFERNSENTFDDMSIRGIKKYISKTKILENNKNSEYLIPVIPNFTIIPKDKSGIKLDKKAYIEENEVIFSDKLEKFEFYLEGIYIDSSYVAAGIVASYQCPSYLKERFKNVSNINPGVRFNIEGDDNSLKVKTTLAREISGFTNNIKDEINLDNYGFVFSSELGHLNNEKITNVTVYKARSLYKNSISNYEAIYKTQTSTYIERILRYISLDFKEDKLNYFFSNSPNSQKTLWSKEQNLVNSILKSGDDISHKIENSICQLNLSFAGEIKNLKIEINKNE